ncbi:MAG: PQQ-binding-like beta-propeller repeat protein [Planctomycetaceae bacterium]|jgi:outer membrane protein assembly factor BamB|nr:PQQ-binding-like beta-propeller repeat protein [Planctomycetaceae bacterium]MBT6484485.1 PQQ-binding-like beta-propeller repeat protein [Planctomycetaceae bacterium]
MKALALCLLAFCLVAGCSRSEPVSEISVDGSQPVVPVEGSNFGPDDWPFWRGPARNGLAQIDNVPTSWDENNNIVWKVDVPGRGHASPTVLGDRIFLATADEDAGTQSVICFDRNDGHQLWQSTVHNGGLPGSLGHQKSTHASSTVATDGERVFASFLNGDAIWVTALDLEGAQLWQTKVGPFDSSYGYAASPAIFKSFVIVAADHNGGGFVAALHRKTGKLQWRKPRPAEQSYASPLVAHVAGKDQVLLCGAYLVASYDPNTGAELWSQEGTTKSCAGTMVYSDDLVYATGGYPDASVACYRADGSGELVWKNNKKLYVPSLLLHDGHLYAANDGGIAFCWNAKTGKNAWTGRLSGNFSASPVLAGGNIYVPNESGTTFVFKATPKTLNIIARNKLGDETMASPVICGDRIFLRVASRQRGTRQEMLYAIGNPE